MSLLIKGMEIPTGDSYIFAIRPDGMVEDVMGCYVGKAIPVPPHGRLIDADALMDLIRAHDYPLTAHFNSRDNGMFTIGIQQAVDETPTIIEAEEGET